MRLDRISPLVAGHRLCRIVIETPRHSRHKYSYDPGLNAIRLKKCLPAGMVFPFDFGFVPATRGADGDPVDALVLADGPLLPGCVMECRIAGLIEAEQKEKSGERLRNDRFIAVADVSLEFQDIREPRDLPTHVLEQTEQFFVNYNRLAGKKFKPLRVLGAKSAWKTLQDLTRNE